MLPQLQRGVYGKGNHRRLPLPLRWSYVVFQATNSEAATCQTVNLDHSINEHLVMARHCLIKRPLTEYK